MINRKTAYATGIALVLASALSAQDQSIIVQSTTSTANSGLYDHLLPIFQDASGIQVNVVAVGTGQAIKNAQNCDGDVLLVHAKSAEEKFVADGYGTQRTDLMYNDFVIVGPVADPAEVDGMQDVQAALAQIAEMGALFASRGDDSGTHKKERALWADAGIDPSEHSGDWYRETGSGMGATLNADMDQLWQQTGFCNSRAGRCGHVQPVRCDPDQSCKMPRCECGCGAGLCRLVVVGCRAGRDCGLSG